MRSARSAAFRFCIDPAHYCPLIRCFLLILCFCLFQCFESHLSPSDFDKSILLMLGDGTSWWEFLCGVYTWETVTRGIRLSGAYPVSMGLGMWERAAEEPAYLDFMAFRHKEYPVDLARDKLPPRLGDKYADVEVACLTSLDKEMYWLGCSLLRESFCSLKKAPFEFNVNKKSSKVFGIINDMACPLRETSKSGLSSIMWAVL
jgi:hypothetical protein